MARLETLVANYLLAIPEIVAISNAAILDVDYRAAGWNAAPVEILDTYGYFIQPTLVVDDGGAGRTPFSRMDMGEEARIYVWVFGNRTGPHIDQMDTLMTLTKRHLHGWQEPTTKYIMRWQDRLGLVPADDGAYNRNEFRLVGIPA